MRTRTMSRRKYGRLNKFLTDTFTNPKVSLRVRMQAALRLADILQNHDAAVQAAEVAVARAAARVAEARVAETAPAGPGGSGGGSGSGGETGLDVEAKALAFLGLLKGRDFND